MLTAFVFRTGEADGESLVRWNEGYRVPADVLDEGADVCDYALARNLIQFAVTLASEAIVRYVLAGERRNYSFTLQDLRINVEGDDAAAYR